MLSRLVCLLVGHDWRLAPRWTLGEPVADVCRRCGLRDARERVGAIR